MGFLLGRDGNNTVEWIVVVVIVVAVLGGVLLTINESLADKLREYNDAL